MHIFKILDILIIKESDFHPHSSYPYTSLPHNLSLLLKKVNFYIHFFASSLFLHISFSGNQSITVYRDLHHSFTQPSIAPQTGCVSQVFFSQYHVDVLWMLLLDVTMNNLVHMSFCVFLNMSLGQVLKVRLSGQMVIAYIILLDIAKFPSQGLHFFSFLSCYPIASAVDYIANYWIVSSLMGKK